MTSREGRRGRAQRWRSLGWRRFWQSHAGRRLRIALWAAVALLLLVQLAGCVPVYGRRPYARSGYYQPYGYYDYSPYGYYDYGPSYYRPYRGYPYGVDRRPTVIVDPPAYRRQPAPIYVTPQGRGPVYPPRQ
jgi:hypothetical protein